MIAVRIVVALLGATLVLSTVLSAVRSFVLPRGAWDRLLSLIFQASRQLFNLRLKRARTYEQVDSAMAMFAPLTLVAVPGVWLFLVCMGYTAIFWALDANGWKHAFEVSGSSLVTLGFATGRTFPALVLSLTEAGVGLILVALLIAYLPAIYAAWSRREEAVALLGVRAGTPPSAVEMIVRHHRIGMEERLNETWANWEVWFANIEETHTSLAVLSFFRSSLPERSWITAAGAILDAAALYLSVVDIPRQPEPALCIRAGYSALRRISEFLRLQFDPDPKPDDPISVTREEFDDACERMAAAGVPLKSDRDQAWKDFAGWRVNYDTVLLRMAALTLAPEAPWVSDRSLTAAAPKKRKKLFVRS